MKNLRRNRQMLGCAAGMVLSSVFLGGCLTAEQIISEYQRGYAVGRREVAVRDYARASDVKVVSNQVSEVSRRIDRIDRDISRMLNIMKEQLSVTVEGRSEIRLWMKGVDSRLDGLLKEVQSLQAARLNPNADTLAFEGRMRQLRTKLASIQKMLEK